MLAFRNNLEQCPGLGAGSLLLNPVFGQPLSQGNGAAGNNGKQAQADGASTDGGGYCTHGQPPLRPGTPRRAL